LTLLSGSKNNVDKTIYGKYYILEDKTET
jgi:hypothetical protein